VHYDEHVAWVEAEAVQDVHYLVLLGALLVDLEPVFAVPSQVAGESDEVAVESGYGPPAVLPFGVVEEEGDSGSFLAPSDEVAELFGAFCVCVSEGDADSDEEAGFAGSVGAAYDVDALFEGDAGVLV
jgi:hypothetical protein